MSKVISWLYSREGIWGEYAVVYRHLFFGGRISLESTWRITRIRNSQSNTGETS